MKAKLLVFFIDIQYHENPKEQAKDQIILYVNKLTCNVVSNICLCVHENLACSQEHE